jgi:hypothetical protein
MQHKLAVLACLLLLVLSSHVAAQGATCVDPDKRIYKNADDSSSSTRDRLTDAGMYCDLALSWNVSNSTVFDQANHDSGRLFFSLSFGYVQGALL